MLDVIHPPTFTGFHIGPLTLHVYGIVILFAVSVWLPFTRNFYSRRKGDPQEINEVALFALPAAIIGGRALHVLTSSDQYFGKSGHPLNAFMFWKPGLSTYGAVISAFFAAYYAFSRKQRSLSFLILADTLGLSFLLAQGMARIGDFFNTDSFGTPTTLPWGLEVPLNLRPPGYEQFTTFHPTVLYESLWCFICAGIILWIPYFSKLAPGKLFIMTIFVYTMARTGIDFIRIDPASQLLGLTINNWLSILGMCASAGLLLFGFRGKNDEAISD